MKIKKNNGFVGVDAIISIIAIMIFSTIIVSLMSHNVIENVKLKKETLATIYISETFERIGIEDYDNVTLDNINNLVPTEALENYDVEMNIETEFEDINNNENIMKKITIKMSYEIRGKKYSRSMERIKVKE